MNECPDAMSLPTYCPLFFGPHAVRPHRKRVISDVYAGKLHSRIAAGLAPLMHLQLRVLEKTEFEKRLGKLERLVGEEVMKNRKGSTADEMPEKG